jgi:hypothetical protein
MRNPSMNDGISTINCAFAPQKNHEIDRLKVDLMKSTSPCRDGLHADEREVFTNLVRTGEEVLALLSALASPRGIGTRSIRTRASVSEGTIKQKRRSPPCVPSPSKRSPSPPTSSGSRTS